MQIGGKRFSRFKKGSHGTCEHTRTHDLDLQIPEESLSGLVPGAAGVDLDVGQLHLITITCRTAMSSGCPVLQILLLCSLVFVLEQSV